MSVQCACRTLCFPAPAPVQMLFRLGFADKKCSFFTVKNFTEQKFQVHKNWKLGHFSDPDYSGPHVMDHGPPGRSRDPNSTFYFLVSQIRGVFSFRGYPRHSPFFRLAPPKGKSCDRPWDSMVCNDVLLPTSIEVNMGMSMNAWRNKTCLGFGFPENNLMDCLRISSLFFIHMCRKEVIDILLYHLGHRGHCTEANDHY